jgi:hypothetical protein
MDPAEFLFLVLPQGFLVFLMVFLVFRSEIERSKYEEKLRILQKQLRKGVIDEEAFKVIGDWMKREEAYRMELQNLKNLREKRQISDQTYLRLKGLLEGLRQYSTARPSFWDQDNTNTV